jgi:signal transduction histidine kinase
MQAGSWRKLGAQWFMVLIVYFVTARFGLGLATFTWGNVTLVWPPTGVSLAALLLFGGRLWPGITVGSFLAAASVGNPLLASMSVAVGNTLEAVCAAWLLRRIPGFHTSLDNLPSVFGLILLGALCSTMLSTVVGIASLRWCGVITPENTLAAGTLWWVGDILSDLVFAPLLLTWAGRPPTRLPSWAWLELGFLVLFVLALSLVVLADPLKLGLGRYALAFIVFPGLIWGALRFGQRGVTVVVACVSAVAIGGTMQHLRGSLAGEMLTGGRFEDRLLLLQLFIAVFSGTGLVLGAAVMARRKSEAQRGALVEQLQEAVRARNEFLSVAAHELKTPLAALSLQVDALVRRLRKEHPSALSETETGKLIDRTGRQIDRLTRLIETLLDVSRIATGRLILERTEVDLGELTRELLEHYQPELTRAGCPTSLDAEAGVVGWWDRLRLEQVVTNLLTNALKFGAGHRIEVTVRGQDDRGVLRVRDHGIGISPTDQGRIFERFERAVSFREFGGMGLGLFVSRQLVQEHGGSIRVESAPGEGSTFIVELPLQRALPAATAAR